MPQVLWEIRKHGKSLGRNVAQTAGESQNKSQLLERHGEVCSILQRKGVQ